MTATNRKPPAIWALLSLLVANLVPVAGVYLWGWSLTELLILYWLESAVIGIFTVLRMVSLRLEGQPLWSHVGTKLTSVPFFIVHYGLFWLVHGVFLLILFGRGPRPVGNGLDGLLFMPVGSSAQQADVLAWPLVLMLISHGVDFVTGHLANGEYRRSTVQEVMTQPYGRVFVLHLTIIAGAFLVVRVGQSQAVLLLFVLMKIIVDVRAHLQVGKRDRTAQVAAA